MFYFLYGTDTDKAREKASEMLASLRKKKPDAELFRLDAESWHEARLDEFVGGQGLFERKFIVFANRLLENEGAKEAVLKKLSAIRQSENVFIFLENKVDKVIVGGGMAYTFLKAKGKTIGSSKLDKDGFDTVKAALDKAVKKNIPILLPVDNVIADKFDQNANAKLVGEDIPDGWMGLDIGPKTIKLFEDKLKTAKTIIWNGPLGVFEMDKFAKGTKEVAGFIAGLKGVTSVIGGGDTAAALSKFRLEDKVTHISTGGGASLEYLEGRGLPGIDALNDK